MHESGTLPRAKRKGIARPAGWTLLAFLLLLPGNLFGQMTNPLTIDGKSRFSASASSSYQFKSSLDGGGDVSIAHYGFGVGGATALNDRADLGVRMTYDREEYDFSNARRFCRFEPMESNQSAGPRHAAGIQVDRQVERGGGPIVQYAGENGASFGDSLMYGVVFSAVYQANPDFMIGLGAGVFYRLEETRIFPSLIVSWKINDRLRLGNCLSPRAGRPGGHRALL